MKQQTTMQHEIKPLNYKQLAAIYDVTHRTLKSWLEPFMEEIGELRGRTFTLKQVRIIYDKLGDPKKDD
jgi:DNA-directed RNA polymerase specialized sigma24 family protein